MREIESRQITLSTLGKSEDKETASGYRLVFMYSIFIKNPPYKYKWTEKTVPIAEGSPETHVEGYMETYKNVSQDIRDQLNAEAEMVQKILTGIDNDIYSTVDACPNACEMWKAIKRLKQGESINVQDLKTNLNWEFGKLTSRDGSLEDTTDPTQESIHFRRQEKEIDKLMDSLLFKKIYKPTNNSLRTSSNTSRAHQDNNPKINIGNGYDNQREINVAGAGEIVGTQMVQQSGIQCFSYKEYGHVAKESRRSWFQLNANQADWKDDADEESDYQELEEHYIYMTNIQKVSPDAKNSGPIFDTERVDKVQDIDDIYNVFAKESDHPEEPESVIDTYLDEQSKNTLIINSLDMSHDREQGDQDKNDDLDNERDLLASLIEKLKCEIDDSKNHNKFLESSNKNLVDKFEDLKKFQDELEKPRDINYMSKVEFDCEKAKDSLEKKDFSKVVTTQTLPQNVKSVSKNNNIIAPGMYKLDTKGNQTRTQQPQLKSNQLEDKAMPNNSQGKTKEVEDHHRKFKFSNNKTSVTTCNDSLNAKNLNVNFVCVTCGKFMLNDNHEMCVLHYIIGVNSMTKQSIVVPISIKESKQIVNQFIATPIKRTVASESANQKPKSKIRKQYEQITKTSKWWCSKITPPGYTCKPKTSTKDVKSNLIEINLSIVDSRFSKHMMGNLKLLSNFMEKFLGTVKFGNDQIALILGFGDLVLGNITINRVYYVEGLNHNLFFVYDANLEVSFRKSTCFIRDLKGNDLLTGSCGSDLYSVTL
uniref:Retrovirus-related Pol polyprotein from transposon TNT 1-94-like beta-barrel domain-containing protein n=1 Tax=Tanacetum cinerariifolium TaxID=118510 RepID=A0A699H805_TANCI|nr:hypothetical protein [Tanacetum cinerariifolium]